MTICKFGRLRVDPFESVLLDRPALAAKRQHVADLPAVHVGRG